MKEGSLIPLASRLVEFKKRGEYHRFLECLTEVDKGIMEDVSQSLYMSGFDVYLPLESMILHQPYRSSRYLVATSEIQSVREHFISRLRFAQTQSGSDSWIHFGSTVYHQEGFSIKETHLGKMFYCNEIFSSLDEVTFAFSVAVYDSFKEKPSPINLRIVPSIKRQEIHF